jgi:hypothetical protein
MTQVVSRRSLTAEDRVRSWVNPCVGFVVEKVALGQVFSEFFGFPLSISFRRGSPNSYHLGNA